MYCAIVGLRYSQFTDVVTLIRTQNNLLKVPDPVRVVDKPKRIPVLLGCCATSVGNWFTVFHTNRAVPQHQWGTGFWCSTQIQRSHNISGELVSGVPHKYSGPTTSVGNWFPVFHTNTAVPQHPQPVPLFQDNSVISKYPQQIPLFKDKKFYGSSYYLLSIHICLLIHSVL